MPETLIGRNQQCSQIDRLLEQVRAGRSATLLIRGEAGIGKTSLVEYAERGAKDMRVLKATGNELDTNVSYAALFDLVRPVMDFVDRMPEPRRGALRSALALSAPERGSPFGVAAALLDLLSAVASVRPVLLLLDDAQWLDAESVNAVAFAARRIVAEGIGVIVAERAGEQSRFAGLNELQLMGLDDTEVATLLVDLGRSPADAHALRVRTAGNPLAVIEHVQSGLSFAALTDMPLPTSESLRAAYLRLVAGLGDRAQRTLLHVAATGTYDMPVLGSVLGEAGLRLSDLAEAEMAGLLTVETGTVTFRHPLVRSAVYFSAPPATRRRVHLAFAAALASSEAPSFAERRVAHLALGADVPDEAIARECEAVGAAAAARRSYATAAETLEVAARLSAEPNQRARRYLAAAQCSLPAGRLAAASRLIAATCEWTSEDETRIAAGHLAYRAMLWQGVPESTYRDLDADDLAAVAIPADGAVILAEAALAASMQGDLRGAARKADRALALAADQPGPVRMPALLSRALLHALALEIKQASALLQQAMPFIASRPGEQWALIAPLVQLLLDELPGAVAGAERVVTTLRSVGAADLLPAPLLILARCEIRRGEFMRARAAAYEAASLIASIGGATSELGGVFEPDCMAVLCLIEAVTGDADQCRRHAKSCLVAGAGRRPDFMTGHGLRALGLLALGSGDALRAIEQLQHLDTLAEDFGIRETPTLSWLADLAEAYLLAGQRENATTTIGRMASHAATVETPTAKALLLRLNALAASDADRLIEAAQQLQQSGMPFESARALLSAGRLLRRRKHIGTARQHLQSARNTFEAIGAGLWREHTEAELRACGVAIATTASPLAALTPQELQVAQLAATGDSNAQIAATLFLSRKTIEFHLSNVFRKIGVTRRAQLASAVPGLLAAVS